MTDRFSLQNLNDIVLPDPVAWWPLAPAWYVLSAAVLLILAFFVYRRRRMQQKNRYRALAIEELSMMRGKDNATALKQLPALLKRTALTVWPRPDVAALSGTEWHVFLDRTATTDQFTSGAGEILDQLAYGVESGPALADGDVQAVMEAAVFWINNHHYEAMEG